MKQENKRCFPDKIMKLITLFTKYDIKHLKSDSFRCLSVTIKNQFTPQSNFYQKKYDYGFLQRPQLSKDLILILFSGNTQLEKFSVKFLTL